MAVNPRQLPGQPTNFAQSGSIGFAVGDPRWLSSQESRIALYWRSIEYGTHGFAGKYLGGLWTSAYKDHSQRGNLIQGRLTPFFGGGGGQQKFVPFFGVMRSPEDAVAAGLKALDYLRRTKGINQPSYLKFRTRLLEGQLGGPTVQMIGHEIIAMESYRVGNARFNPRQREIEAMREVFGRLGFRDYGNRPVSLLSQRHQRPAPTTRTAFQGRTGFLTAGVLRGYNYSLVQLDATLRRELTQVNRLLAAELAETVADVQRSKIKRPDVSTGALLRATMAPQNRFPG